MGILAANPTPLSSCYLNANPSPIGSRMAVSLDRQLRLTLNFKLLSFRGGSNPYAASAVPRVPILIQGGVQLRLGRGVVYLGSSRLGPGHPHYTQAFNLAKDIASLLNCTSWSGAGPGLMDAVTKGALEAKKPIGGFKIGKEAGEWTASNFHPYLPADTYLTCRFFSARKHGLVDAAVRATDEDKTAVVALPGGIGTLDEAFEILALIQLQRIGSELAVPFLLMKYDSFYSKLLDFIGDLEGWGTIADGEMASLWKVCDRNAEALDCLADYYGLDV